MKKILSSHVSSILKRSAAFMAVLLVSLAPNRLMPNGDAGTTVCAEDIDVLSLRPDRPKNLKPPHRPLSLQFHGIKWRGLPSILWQFMTTRPEAITTF